MFRSSTSSSDGSPDGPGRSLDLGGLSLRSLALACALLAVAAGLGEVAVRAAAGSNAYLNERMLRYDPLSALVEPHGEFGFRQKPNTFFRYAGGKGATSNAQGFRGPEVELPKPAGRRRVLMLGGSPTHGWGVDDDETIDHYMREMFAVRGRSEIDVVNLAMDAYDSWQLYERLKTEAVLQRPDVVIVSAGIVDVGLGRYADLRPADPRTLAWEGTIGRFRHGGAPSWPDRLKHASRLVQFVLLEQHELAASAPIGETLHVQVEVHPDAVTYFGANLRRLADTAAEYGAPVLFVTPPSGIQALYQAEDTRGYGFWLGSAVATERYRVALAQEMRRVAREQTRLGRTVKYIAPKLDDELFLDDAHLRPEGNEALAGQFVRAIEPWLTGRGPGDPGSAQGATRDAVPAESERAP